MLVRVTVLPKQVSLQKVQRVKNAQGKWEISEPEASEAEKSDGTNAAEAGKQRPHGKKQPS